MEKVDILDYFCAPVRVADLRCPYGVSLIFFLLRCFVEHYYLAFFSSILNFRSTVFRPLLGESDHFIHFLWALKTQTVSQIIDVGKTPYPRSRVVTLTCEVRKSGFEFS